MSPTGRRRWARTCGTSSTPTPCGATSPRSLRGASRRCACMLSWDAFMPTDRAPNPRRMRDLEPLLGVARELGLRVVPTLFAQSIGDCVMLPAYAVDRRAPRRGVRCVTDARVVDGGPRDIYTDPLMLEVQVRWLDAMLGGVRRTPGDRGVGPGPRSGGDDPPAPHRRHGRLGWRSSPSVCMRRTSMPPHPRAGRRAARPRRCGLASLAAHVDALGLVLRPQRLPLPGDAARPWPGGLRRGAGARACRPDGAAGGRAGVASGERRTRRWRGSESSTTSPRRRCRSVALR